MANRRSISKPPEKTFTCIKCGKDKRKAEFYKSYHPNHKDGIIPYCKECARKMCSDEKGRVVKEKLVNFLKDEEVNKPFIESVWNISVSDKSETLGVYMRNLALTKYRALGWSDGETNAYSGGLTVEDLEESYKSNNFVVTKEIMEEFGEGYSEEEYKVMKTKFDKLSPFYPMPTLFHKEALMNYIRAKAKEEVAIAKNNMTDAKFWGDIARQAAKDANINPSQLKAQDTKDGLNSFSKIYEEVERAVDIVPILPKFKHRPADSADFIIFENVNYIRDLLGMPLCEYEDVYSFYDRSVEAYIKKHGDEYGIFTDDPTIENRPRIRVFLDDCKEKVDG